MELFGQKVTRKEALVGGGVVSGVAAVITALALWGDKPVTFEIRSTNSCDSDHPTFVRNTNTVLNGFSDAEVTLLARDGAGVGTPVQRQAAKYDIRQLAQSVSGNQTVLKNLSADELTCTVHTAKGDRLALSDKAEEIVGELKAAGVEVDLTGTN